MCENQKCTPPAVVAALVDALEACLERLVKQDEATQLEEDVRAALAAYREAGR